MTQNYVNSRPYSSGSIVAVSNTTTTTCKNFHEEKSITKKEFSKKKNEFFKNPDRPNFGLAWPRPDQQTYRPLVWILRNWWKQKYAWNFNLRGFWLHQVPTEQLSIIQFIYFISGKIQFFNDLQHDYYFDDIYTTNL